MTEDERVKVDLITTLVDESTVTSVELLLTDAPVWADAFVAELVEDGIALVFRVDPSDDAIDVLRRGEIVPAEDAVDLVRSGARRGRSLWIAAGEQAGLLQHEPSRLFRYAAGDRDAARG